VYRKDHKELEVTRWSGRKYEELFRGRAEASAIEYRRGGREKDRQRQRERQRERDRERKRQRDDQS